jgi:hypothetical protein
MQVSAKQAQAAPYSPPSLSVAVWMAWRRYLLSVRASSRQTYEVAEESAWERLADELSRAGASAFRS